MNPSRRFSKVFVPSLITNAIQLCQQNSITWRNLHNLNIPCKQWLVCSYWVNMLTDCQWTNGLFHSVTTKIYFLFIVMDRHVYCHMWRLQNGFQRDVICWRSTKLKLVCTHRNRCHLFNTVSVSIQILPLRMSYFISLLRASSSCEVRAASKKSNLKSMDPTGYEPHNLSLVPKTTRSHCWWGNLFKSLIESCHLINLNTSWQYETDYG